MLNVKWLNRGGANIRRRDENGADWRVELQNKVHGSFTLNISWDQARISTNGIELVGISATGVERETDARPSGHSKGGAGAIGKKNLRCPSPPADLNSEEVPAVTLGASAVIPIARRDWPAAAFHFARCGTEALTASVA